MLDPRRPGSVQVPRRLPLPSEAPRTRLESGQSPPAPQVIRERIDQLGAGFDGRVGIAVRSVEDGWSTGWHAGELYPQQSVSKLWVAITAMDAVDRGARAAGDR